MKPSAVPSPPRPVHPSALHIGLGAAPEPSEPDTLWSCWGHTLRTRSRAADVLARQPLLAALPIPASLLRWRHVANAPSRGVPTPYLAEALLAHMQRDTRQDRQLVYDTLMDLRAERLLAVKQWLERRSPGALYDLVFKTPLLRQAPALVQHMQANAPAQPTGSFIVSDIDNTFCPSRDRGFPKTATSYPGRAAFFQALVEPGTCDERVCFLSARFGDAICRWKWLSRRERRVTLDNLKRGGMHNPRVLFGKLWDIPRPRLFGINWTPLGGRKLRNFHNLGGLFPEYRYVFFGDTCEDDLRVGRAMLADGDRRVGVVFMHDLAERGRTVNDRARADAQQAGMIFYTTIPGAALAAYRAQEAGAVRLGLTPAKLRSVAQAAIADLDAIAFDSPEQRAAATQKVRADVRALCEHLGDPMPAGSSPPPGAGTAPPGDSGPVDSGPPVGACMPHANHLDLERLRSAEPS